MKNVIKVAVLVLVTAVSAATLSAQAAGAKQMAPTKAAAKTDKAPAAKDAKADKTPCKAGEVLKDAKKPFDAKTNPCVAKPVKK
jgi:hypothetical protein